ncbi:MAG TPA: cobyrinate a,c-diamide synthase [Piscinibacter sp.]|nr:cobyrinate a,c-diamide synthase [Piscinibacter sp.]HPG79779.1 cobyrinate a,c-diamide synthase [Piscinibacter sp.]
MGTPGLLVSAAHKSSGKTTVTLGLAAALALRGHLVQPFKKGPDYIDPMWLSLAAGRACVNLDPTLMARDEIDTCFAQHGAGAGLRLVEGNKGLYDGLALDGSNSNAALAKQLGLPVLLVLDARGMTRGIAPLILGYQAFDRDIRIGGVILNRLGGSRHEAKLRAVIEHYTDVPVLGAVQNDPRLELVERHLGLMPDREVDDALARVRAMGEVIAAQVDLPRILTLAATATTASPPAPERPRPPQRDRLRIGVARDKAFGFYYPDDLAALEADGATLVPLDTLNDSQLPPLDGLFIGGGFPELFMAELEANVSLRTQLHRAIADGLPVFAECGGLMYLARTLNWNGRSAQMVGAIPGDAVMHERPVGRGYVRLQETADFPWPRDAGAGDGALRLGHEFHHSSLENLDPSVRCAYRVQRGHGIGGGRDGVLVHNVLASYAHLRHTGGNDWPRRFMAFVRDVKRRDEAQLARLRPALTEEPAWSAR